MNLRHATALAFLGWYLMVPHNGPNEPISEWYHAGSFDTAERCTALLQWEKTDDYSKQAQGTPIEKQEYQNALKDAQCVATDDPRLKGN
jgi:hypothetical protein